MKVVVRDSHTVIFLTREEALDLCKPGEEGNTCVWLVVGGDGFECTFFNRPTALLKRWARGDTVARRNGCEVVKALNYEVKYAESSTLQEIIDSKRVPE